MRADKKLNQNEMKKSQQRKQSPHTSSKLNEGIEDVNEIVEEEEQSEKLRTDGSDAEQVETSANNAEKTKNNNTL